jgi:hypothetical protein
VTEAPVQLEYATPARAAKIPLRKSVFVAVAAVLFGFIGVVMPPLVGSGLIGFNVFWTPTWWITFGFLDAYVWLRIRESRPLSRSGGLLTGLGGTGALIALALILLDWKPNVPLLSVVCAASFVVAAVGRWITRRCTGPAGQNGSSGSDCAERPAGQ